MIQLIDFFWDILNLDHNDCDSNISYTIYRIMIFKSEQVPMLIHNSKKNVYVFKKDFYGLQHLI